MRSYCNGSINYIVFVYFDQDYQPLYCKLRRADGVKTGMRCIPQGRGSILYNLPVLQNLKSDEAPILTEGEFDVAALLEAGERGVVSVPNGAGSALTPTLLKPLKRFSHVFIGVDNDEAGDALAYRLADLLGPSRCNRIDWKGGQSHAAQT